MPADVARGKIVSSRCYMCHHIDGAGVDYGPALTDYGKTQTSEVILNAIINPGSDIAHGFNGHTVVTKDDIKIQGRLLSAGDPLIMQSTGGITQMIPKNQVKKQWKLKESLMMSAAQQGLTEQDLADLVAYLKSI
jgi:putative heme-binding domain-containing protein